MPFSRDAGTAVACTDLCSLPEVAGDIAVLFDPYDEVAMAGAMKRLLAEAAQQSLAVLEGAAGEGWP